MNKVVKSLYISMWVIVILSFILKPFCSDLFLIADDNKFLIDLTNFVNRYIIIDFIVNFTMYSISWYLVTSIALKRLLKPLEVICLLPIYIILFLVCGIFSQSKIMQVSKIVIELVIYFIFCMIKHINMKHTIKVCILNIIYQCLSVLTKGIALNTIYTLGVALLLNLDYYCLLIIAFVKERYNVRLAKLYIPISNKGSKTKGLSKVQNFSEEHTTPISIEDNLDKILKPIFFIGVGSLQFFLVLFIGRLINNTIINISYIIVSFLISRKILGNSWHANSLIVCTSTSALLFGVCAKLSVPLGYSLLLNVFIGFILAYLLNKLYISKKQGEVIKELESELQALRNNIESKKSLEINSMTKEQMKQEYKHLTDWEISLLYDVINRGSKTMNQVARKYGYSVMQIYRIVKRIRQSL